MLVPLDILMMPVVFQYNPYEIHEDSIADWQQLAVAGREAPYLHFGCGRVHRVSFSLEISRNDRGDNWVKTFSDSIRRLTKPLVRGAGLHRPTRVQAILGAHLNMTCVVEDAKVRYGAHRGMTHHMTYMAAPLTLLPRDGHITIHLFEWI